MSAMLHRETHCSPSIPPTRLQIVGYGKEAEDYTNQNYTNPTPQRDAIRHSFWNALCASDSWIPLQSTSFVTTAHEWNNKWGYDNTGANVAPQPAFDSTMDFHNNSVEVSIVHFTPDGISGHVPDRSAILSDLANKYSTGVLYIWDGGGDQSHSQGILLKSNGKKIY